MEIILKHHNQIELPREVCRKLELIPGIQLEVEVDGETGAIVLQPITRKMKQIRLHASTEQFEKIKSASR